MNFTAKQMKKAAFFEIERGYKRSILNRYSGHCEDLVIRFSFRNILFVSIMVIVYNVERSDF